MTPRPTPARVLWLLGMFAAAGCNAILGIDAHGVSSDAGGSPDSTIPDGGPGEAAVGTADADGGATQQDATTGSDASQDAASSDAPAQTGDASQDAPGTPEGGSLARGPVPVHVSVSLEGGTVSFAVDSTEVTEAEYTQFLAATDGGAASQPAPCGWNTTYLPAAGPMNGGAFPQTNVDWCDAFAFCAWAGKHLCGAMDGGALPSAYVLDQTRSQFYLACGGPYGGTDPNANPRCNATFGNGDLWAVSSNDAGCEGFYQGLFDLEGNAAEWVDSCDRADGGPLNGSMDSCYVLGGSFIDETAYCDESTALPRNETAYSVGFRCCGP